MSNTNKISKYKNPGKPITNIASSAVGVNIKYSLQVGFSTIIVWDIGSFGHNLHCVYCADHHIQYTIDSPCRHIIAVQEYCAKIANPLILPELSTNLCLRSLEFLEKDIPDYREKNDPVFWPLLDSLYTQIYNLTSTLQGLVNRSSHKKKG